jgi:hypothetical protein
MPSGIIFFDKTQAELCRISADRILQGFLATPD